MIRIDINMNITFEHMDRQATERRAGVVNRCMVVVVKLGKVCVIGKEIIHYIIYDIKLSHGPMQIYFLFFWMCRLFFLC